MFFSIHLFIITTTFMMVLVILVNENFPRTTKITILNIKMFGKRFFSNFAIQIVIEYLNCY